MASALALALARFPSITRRASCIKRRFSSVGRFPHSSISAHVGGAFAFTLCTTHVGGTFAPVGGAFTGTGTGSGTGTGTGAGSGTGTGAAAAGRGRSVDR